MVERSTLTNCRINNVAAVDAPLTLNGRVCSFVVVRPSQPCEEADVLRGATLDYEFPALPAELQARISRALKRSTPCVTNPQSEKDRRKFRIAHFELPIWDGDVVRGILNIIEIAVLSILILATRCANYQDVFVAGNVYFTDADCYARMTRVRMCSEHPGLILRHHDFENFPAGTTPHTTAPLDYLILALSILLKPFNAHTIDLAGALISPLAALLGGWFLWWWSVKLRYRWVMLILYAISPILVHGTALGRPDHQSLLMLLVMVAVCAEWSRAEAADTATNLRKWSLISGIAWGLAIWSSAYESLVLFLLVMIVMRI